MRWIWAIVLCGVLAAGCKTTDSIPKPVASAVFRGNTPGQISKVLDETFATHGYEAKHITPTTMLFEKKGSLGSNIMYGNWNGDSPVWIRVKGTLVPIGEPGFRLDCTATRVRDRGSSLEEEIPYGKPGGKPFQAILDEAAAKLSGTTPSAP